MADGIFLKSGGGVTSEDVSIGRHQALKGTRLLTSDSNDRVVLGMMPDNSTRTSNGTVPGVSSDRAELPTRYTESMFMSTDTAGNRRLNMSPPQGYYPGSRKSFVSHRAIELGNAVAGQVLSGATFSSEQGLKLWGEVPGWLPRISGWSDVVYAWNDEVKVGDDAQGNRGMYTKIPNGHYINGANWVFSKEANLRPENIRAGVSIAGMVGTMPDYSTGRVVFNGATFDGVLVSGVANNSTRFGDDTTSIAVRGLIYNQEDNSHHTFRFKPQRTTFGHRSDRAYTLEGIHSGGLAIRVEKYGDSEGSLKAAYVMKESINLTPFRTVKVGYKMINISSNSDKQPALNGGHDFRPSYLKAAVCVSSTSLNGRVFTHGESLTSEMSGGKMVENAHYFERRTKLDIPNDSQQYLHLDISDMSGPHFLIIGASADGYASPMGTVVFNHIELIN